MARVSKRYNPVHNPPPPPSPTIHSNLSSLQGISQILLGPAANTFSWLQSLPDLATAPCVSLLTDAVYPQAVA